MLKIDLKTYNYICLNSLQLLKSFEIYLIWKIALKLFERFFCKVKQWKRLRVCFKLTSATAFCTSVDFPKLLQSFKALLIKFQNFRQEFCRLYHNVSVLWLAYSSTCQYVCADILIRIRFVCCNCWGFFGVISTLYCCMASSQLKMWKFISVALVCPLCILCIAVCLRVWLCVCASRKQ